jgi:hypothetical protein
VRIATENGCEEPGRFCGRHWEPGSAGVAKACETLGMRRQHESYGTVDEKVGAVEKKARTSEPGAGIRDQRDQRSETRDRRAESGERRAGYWGVNAISFRGSSFFSKHPSHPPGCGWKAGDWGGRGWEAAGESACVPRGTLSVFTLDCPSELTVETTREARSRRLSIETTSRGEKGWDRAAPGRHFRRSSSPRMCFRVEGGERGQTWGQALLR